MPASIMAMPALAWPNTHRPSQPHTSYKCRTCIHLQPPQVWHPQIGYSITGPAWAGLPCTQSLAAADEQSGPMSDEHSGT
eukprot:1159783-Pelagomonas_calceolata.AAC.7